MSTVLVTGVAGFIGSAVARLLLRQGHNIVGIDNLSTGYRENIPDQVSFIHGNVQDSDVIERLNEHKLDTIYHIAGQSSGEISFMDPVYDLQTNCQSTLMLLDFACRNDCSNFIYAGTMSVYGDPRDNSQAVTEEHPLNPISFYAVGKVASEKYMRIYSRQYGMSCTSLRLFNVYGPGQNMSNMKQGMVSIFIAQALKNNKITVKGSKDRFRDQVYIDDAAEAFWRARCKIRKGFTVYNISTGVKTTVEDVINMIHRNIPNLEETTYDHSTPGDQFGIFGNSCKAQKDLDWHPITSFTHGFNKMFQWAVRGV